MRRARRFKVRRKGATLAGPDGEAEVRSGPFWLRPLGWLLDRAGVGLAGCRANGEPVFGNATFDRSHPGWGVVDAEDGAAACVQRLVQASGLGAAAGRGTASLVVDGRMMACQAMTANGLRILISWSAAVAGPDDGERDLMAAVVDSAPLAISVTDPAGMFRLVNTYFCQCLGQPRWQLLGRHHADVSLVPEGGSEADPDTILWTRVPLVDDQGRDTGHVADFGLDITARRHAELELIAAKGRAEAASAAKSSFLATMSHELRTPLNAIIGLSDVMLQELMGPLGEPNYSELVHDINESGRQLLEIINDVLEIARFEAGETTMLHEMVDIAAVVRACLGLIRSRADKAQVQLVSRVPDFPLGLFGDRRALMKVLVHLAVNGIKFTPADGRVTVSADADADGAVVIQVADTGIGIDAAFLPHIFEPFRQGDMRASRRYGGAGLGLSVCKALVEQHGGTITVDSALGVGTTVTLRFPAGICSTEIAGSAAGILRLIGG